jgi:hypothetical protein
MHPFFVVRKVKGFLIIRFICQYHKPPEKCVQPINIKIYTPNMIVGLFIVNRVSLVLCISGKL